MPGKLTFFCLSALLLLGSCREDERHEGVKPSPRPEQTFETFTLECRDNESSVNMHADGPFGEGYPTAQDALNRHLVETYPNTKFDPSVFGRKNASSTGVTMVARVDGQIRAIFFVSKPGKGWVITGQ